MQVVVLVLLNITSGTPAARPDQPMLALVRAAAVTVFVLLTIVGGNSTQAPRSRSARRVRPATVL